MRVKEYIFANVIITNLRDVGGDGMLIKMNRLDSLLCHCVDTCSELMKN